MTISIECPMNCFDACKARVEISPYDEIDALIDIAMKQ